MPTGASRSRIQESPSGLASRRRCSSKQSGYLKRVRSTLEASQDPNRPPTHTCPSLPPCQPAIQPSAIQPPSHPASHPCIHASTNSTQVRWLGVLPRSVSKKSLKPRKTLYTLPSEPQPDRPCIHASMPNPCPCPAIHAYK